MTNQRKIDGLLHVVTGGLIMAGCVWWGWVRQNALFPAPVRLLGLGFGLGVASLWIRSADWAVIRSSRVFCLSFLSLVFTIGALEAIFRLSGFDFTREEANWRRLPPFERQPIVPSGTVFFRRPGPEQWSGQVMNTTLRELHIAPNPYHDEPRILVRYNRLGFRNPEGFADWEIAVAGDSFTELGYLTDDQLFTAILGQTLHTRVANFGTSYTGPLTQLSYLKDCGLAPSIRKTVIVFFEGNDLLDLQEEYAALKEFERTGQRPYRKFSQQTSMLRAIYRLVRDSRLKAEARAPVVTAFFKSSHGNVPITLNYTPPNRRQIPDDGMSRLDYFFSQYETFGREHGIATWLAFMPCKERVVYGMIDFATNAPERFRQWQPTDLPQTIGDVAASHKVRFVDLTPALVKETTSTKELLFNSIYDTHLTASGSQVVAQELARRLAEPPATPHS